MELYIYAKLKKLYPDRCVSNMYKEHPVEYGYLREVASKNRMSISEYLESIGFKYLIGKNGSSPMKFDAQTAKLLIDEYDFTGMDFAKIFHVTRAEISRKILNNVIHTSWTSNYLRYSETQKIHELVQEESFELLIDDLYIRISNNKNDICIFIINNSTIKVVFDLPERLNNHLKKRNYHKLGPQDMEIKRDLNPVKVMGKTMASYVSGDISSKIRNRYVRLGITRDEYLRLLGYDGLCRNGKGTDQDILNILQKYADSKKRIYFPNTGPYKPAEYNTIANKASREHMSLEELFQFFGFTKVSENQFTAEMKKAEYFKQEISQLCIENTNKIYLDANSELYKRFYSFCKIRNKPMDDLLDDWGFERVSKKEYQSYSNITANNTNG